MICTLQLIVQLDVAAARAKYTNWVDGSYPEFTPIPNASGAESAVDAMEVSEGSVEGIADNHQEEKDQSEGFLVRLEQFRNPLLLGQYLVRRWGKGTTNLGCLE